MTQDQQEPQETESQSPAPTEEVEDHQEPKTYDEDYVKKLRDEAAGKRVKFDKAQKQLMEQSLQMHAAELQDPADLLVYQAEEDLLDEDGLPSPEKIKAATEELVKVKPHLKKVVYQDIGQGPRGKPEEEKPRDFNDWIKSASG